MKKSSNDMLSGMSKKSNPGDTGVRLDKMAGKIGAGEIGRTGPPKVPAPGGRVA